MKLAQTVEEGSRQAHPRHLTGAFRPTLASNL